VFALSLQGGLIGAEGVAISDIVRLCKRSERHSAPSAGGMMRSAGYSRVLRFAERRGFDRDPKEGETNADTADRES